MENQVINVPLASIKTSSTNEIMRGIPLPFLKKSHDRFNQTKLAGLASSIKEVGVIQPVTVRPINDEQGKFDYELVVGEQRFKASAMAGKEDIPVIIRTLSDEMVATIQVIENIQREPMHPLNEGDAFRFILDNDKTQTAATLALTVGKSESYIVQRLKLIDLVKEAKNDFYTNRMNIGHAIILARLTPQDQQMVIKRFRENGGFGAVNALQQFVERYIMNSLSEAPFDTNDGELYPKAGPCSTCVKRSGASPLLFADIKEKDKCADRACFLIKCRIFLVNRTKEIIETQPDVVFLTDFNKPADEITKMLEEHKIKPLRHFTDFHEQRNGGQKVTGLWISGDKVGQTVTVYRPKTEKEPTRSEAENATLKIEQIQHRIKRAKELDREKVYAKILESLSKHPTQQKGHSRKIMADEEVMLWYIIYDKAGYHLRNELTSVIGLSKSNPEKFYHRLKQMKPEQKAYMLRKVMLDQYGGNDPDSNHGFIIRKIASGYGDIEISTFEKEQKEICEKREIRAKKRVKELQEAKKKIAA